MTTTTDTDIDGRNVICATAPEGLLAELTHRCPLQCVYCSNPLDLDRHNAELETQAWIDVFRQAAAMGIVQVHLSGGEPTVRRDLAELVREIAKLGMYSNLITAAVTLDRARFVELLESGIDHVQISIQDTDAASAEQLSAYRGGLAKKRQVATWVVEADLPLTINAPVHRQNIDRLEDLIAFAVDLGAHRLEVAHVQYYGWAYLNRATLMPTYEQALRSQEVVEQARERLRGILSIDFVAPDYYARTPKPCMGGWGRRFMNVSPKGDVLPCHAAHTIPGLQFDNVKSRRLRDIWLHSAAFSAFRGDAWMKEPCRSCPMKTEDYGGCRCQAWAFTGDPRNTDPACTKSPMHSELLQIARRESLAVAPPVVYRRFGGAGGTGSEAPKTSNTVE
jgi:pyrroloquinoline quinone biosynthesis protein E